MTKVQRLVTAVSALLCLSSCVNIERPVARTVAQDGSIEHISVNGATFHVQTYGDAANPAVFVLHGGPGNDFRYLLDLKELSDEYFVIFYDQRGTGLSPRVDIKELTMASTLSDLSAIIDYYRQDEPVNIIGHSWGAMLGSAYLGQYPERVNSIVLAEPGFLTPEQALIFQQRTKLSMSLPTMVGASKVWYRSNFVNEPDDQASADYFMTELTMHTPIKNHPMAGYFCDNDLNNAAITYWRYSKSAAQGIMNSAMDDKGRFTYNFVEGVEQFENKVLLLTGECNSVIGSQYQQAHLPYFKNIEMIEIEGVGHTMFGEDPEQSMTVIRRYFKE